MIRLNKATEPATPQYSRQPDHGQHTGKENVCSCVAPNTSRGYVDCLKQDRITVLWTLDDLRTITRHKSARQLVQMAEAAGLAFGALALTTTLSDVLECFEYIENGEQFSQDFQRYLLRLSVLRLRLSRWGASLSIDNPLDRTVQLNLAGLSPEEMNGARELLADIQSEFTKAETLSKNYHSRVIEHNGDNAGTHIGNLQDQVRKIVMTRQRKTSFAAKAKWAFHDRKKLEAFVKKVSHSVQDLFEVCPAGVNEIELCKQEASEIQDAQQLALLSEASSEDDTILHDVVKQAYPTLATESYSKIQAEKEAKIFMGIAIADGIAVVPQLAGKRTFYDVNAKDKARICMGVRIGMKDIFD